LLFSAWRFKYLQKQHEYLRNNRDINRNGVIFGCKLRQLSDVFSRYQTPLNLNLCLSSSKHNLKIKLNVNTLPVRTWLSGGLVGCLILSKTPKIL
jgi:hypothetical protein